MGIFASSNKPAPQRKNNQIVELINNKKDNSSYVIKKGLFGDTSIERRNNLIEKENNSQSSSELLADKSKSLTNEFRKIVSKRRSGSSSPVPAETEKLELIAPENRNLKEESSKNMTEESIKVSGKRAIDAHTGVIKDPPHSQDTCLLNREKYQII